MIVIDGEFSRSLDFFRFMNIFKELELSQPHHCAEQPIVNYFNRNIQIKLSFVDDVSFLLESSFKNGMLKEWNSNFQLDANFTDIIDRYAKKCA